MRRGPSDGRATAVQAAADGAAADGGVGAAAGAVARKDGASPSPSGGAASPSSTAAPTPPASFPPPVARTLDWLQDTFSAYYADHPPEMPERYTRREFGFILWPERPGPPPFLRHRAYADKDRFLWYLRKKGPHSVYYSTAYYRQPAELRMVDKQWLGAELIFDLDADHLPEAQAAAAEGRPMPLDEQLAVVKRRFRYLLDEFLFGDFGLDEKDVFLTFSGGRGYHAHVTDPRLIGLHARGRREIVDYVTGKVPAARGSDQPDLSPFIRKRAVGHRPGPYARAATAEFLAPASAPGWPGRLTRSLVAALQDNVLEASRSDARAWLVSLEDIGEKRADEFLAAFDAEKLRRVGEGYLEQGAVVKRVCRHVLAEAALPLSKGETDEPVTADTKRLIRLPGSLHGKTGFATVRLTRDELDAFDPFIDAVAFQGGTVRIVPRQDNELSLACERVRVVAGEEVEVPTAHAVFWCARQQGTLAEGR